MLYVFLLLIASLHIHANDQISEKMKLMRDGMVTIQDGFLYNQVDLAHKGISMLEDSLKVDKKALLPQNKTNMIGMVQRTTTNIENSLKNMSEFLKNKDIANAAAEYSNVVNACTICHKIVRGW